MYYFVVYVSEIENLSIPDIYIALLQETYSEVLSIQIRPKGIVFRSFQKEDTLQAQRNREFIPSVWANHRGCSTLFKRRGRSKNQELTTSRRTKGSAGS